MWLVSATLVGAVSVEALATLGFCRAIRLPGGRRSAWSLAWMGGAMALMTAAMGKPILLRHAPPGLPLLFLVLLGAGLYCAASSTVGPTETRAPTRGRSGQAQSGDPTPRARLGAPKGG